MNLPFLLAKRLYSPAGNADRAALPAIRIAIAGVAVGVAVMIVATAVALGFKDEITSKVIGFGSHIMIVDATASPEQADAPVTITDSLSAALKGVGNIRHTQTFSLKPGIFKTENDFSGITLKGIGKNYDCGFIKAHIVEGRMPQFGTAAAANDIVISHSQAQALKLKCGDRVFAYFFDQGLRTRRMRIAAVYRTDLSQFDNQLVFADLKTVSRLNAYADNQVSGFEISLNDFSKLYETSMKVGKALSYYNIYHNTQYAAYNIKDLYPQIFSWLDLLNINITVILILMILVAGVTIVSGLLILILERTGTIAMLKAIGATNGLVRSTFIDLALMILTRGMLIGNAAGLLIAFAQKEFRLFSLDPSSYYIDTVPIEFSLPAILAINALTFVAATLALILPSHLASVVSPSKVLRFE